MKPDIAFGDFFNNTIIQRLHETSISPSTKDTFFIDFDEYALIKSEQFRIFKDKILSYIYSFLRVLEFESCWLISCKDTDFKILLGEKIGFDAICLDALHNRIFEKLASKYIPTANASYSRNFAKAINLQDECDIASFLYFISQDLYANIQTYLSEGDRTADEPTYITLMNIASGLIFQVEKLKQWCRKDFSIASLSSISELENISHYSGNEEIPEIKDFPGRSGNISFSEASIVTHKSYADLMTDRDKLKRFSHYVYMDVEVAAMEVCAKNIVAYRHMPLDFKLDMARQIWDEARHTIMMRRFLVALGGKEGDYTYSAKVWKKCKKGSNLTERLAIQQVFQEGNALESNFLLTESFRNAGNDEMTRFMDFINADEAVHVKIGNFWMKYLLNGDDRAYQATMEKAVGLVNSTLSSNVEVNRAARKISDFPDTFVDILEENNKIHGYRKT